MKSLNSKFLTKSQIPCKFFTTISGQKLANELLNRNLSKRFGRKNFPTNNLPTKKNMFWVT